MISVENALSALFDITPKMTIEWVALSNANGRVLAQTVEATRDQPPFSASAMDGYAISNKDLETHHEFTVVGTSSAGHGFHGFVQSGQAVRIFTGAPMPKGTDRVIIQEDVTPHQNNITLSNNYDTQSYVRPMGIDFEKGYHLHSPKRLRSADIMLLAAMNISKVPVFKKPTIAIISTGDELVMPGQKPTHDQIIASNTYGLAALIQDLGANPRILPIAQDNLTSLEYVLSLAEGADLIVTIGGASVGDHDLVAQAAANFGIEQHFYKVAMRPGKPLMAGKIGDSCMIGLPGNPVSAMVCGHIFLAPVINAMLGLGNNPALRLLAPIGHDLNANGKREHYMRATINNDGILYSAESQDSARIAIFTNSTALIVRPPNALALKQGEFVQYIPI